MLLTCHFVSSEFEMHHCNLFTHHLPRVHDHVNIAEAQRVSTTEWRIDLQDQVMTFTTDNGSYIVKAIRDDLQKLHIPCVGPTLNLAVQAALKVPRLSRILARCRKTVLHFNKSCVDQEELAAKQVLLKLPKHSLIQEVTTR